MIPIPRSMIAIATAWGLGSAPAFAAPVVVSPLAADASVNVKQRALVFQTLSSELDFFPTFDRAIALDARPSTLTASCLDKAECLGRIARNKGAEALVAGTVRRRGTTFTLDLVYYDGGRIQRRQTFSVPTDPSGLGNAMGPVVKQLVTGQQEETPVAPVGLGLDDLDDFEDEPAVIAPPPQAPAPGRRIQFGSAEIETAPLDEDEELIEDDPGIDALPPAEVPADTAKEEKRAARDLERLRRERTRSDDDDESSPHYVKVSGRFGGSRYHAFNFITVGGEAAVRVVEGLHLVAGLESWWVNQALAESQADQVGQERVWVAVYPVNLGVLYQFGDGRTQPYVGIETVFAQYYEDDEIGTDWTRGLRMRAGVDWMVVDHFGLNANLAIGGWLGQYWPQIDDRLGRAGWVPQLSVGPVIAL